jgi:hypothetical protein
LGRREIVPREAPYGVERELSGKHRLRGGFGGEYQPPGSQLPDQWRFQPAPYAVKTWNMKLTLISDTGIAIRRVSSS